MHPSTHTAQLEQLLTTMTAQMTRITSALGTWVLDAPRDLQQIEQHVLQCLKELGMTLGAGLCALRMPPQPVPTARCACGHLARYQRQRPATVITLLGTITLQRPYYHCAACGHGHHPLDAQLAICAGSRSAGLDERLALLGATQDSFAEAASVLERLTLVHVSPNSVRAATEDLGAVLVADQGQHATAAEAGHPRSPAEVSPPQRLYITMDGVLAHLHDTGWSEVKVGCCYQTRSRPARQRPARVEEVRAHSLSYVTARMEAQAFGWQLWQEAARRGVLAAAEVVVIGDGAHWIWNIADTHFPGATQIVDWYHASTYVWLAASAIWGETAPQRVGWAHCQLDALWAGQVAQVLVELAHHQTAGEGVTAALSYYTTHRQRMDYAAYRARGLQIGSGSIESACKQLVSARRKQAGMIWDATGAEQVATVRAWLKSGRWQEALALRARRQRGYARQRPRAGTGAEWATGQGEPPEAARPVPTRASRGLSPAVLAQVQAERAQAKGTHVWRLPWSVKRQRECQAASRPAVGITSTA